MNCKEFEQLNIIEKVDFIGKLNHLVQTSPTAFLAGKALVESAEDVGMFDKIKICPDEIEGQVIPPLT